MMNFVKQNIYYFLFVALIVEWPIISFIGGEYASQGKLNLSLFFMLAIVADIVWDVCIYIIWRFFSKWKLVDKFNPLKKLKNYITEKKFFDKLLSRYPFFFFLITKITPYLATPSLFSIWMKKYHFWKFVFFSVIISCIVKTVYIWLWYIWGISLAKLKIIHEWWSEFVLFVIIWFILFYLVKFFIGKYSEDIINWLKKFLKKFQRK